MPLNLQSKLLRVIQESEIWRVGGQRPIKLDLRIIVATQRDLEKEVKIGNFREDLYHRLNVVKLEIPPLRERTEDVVILANYFLQKQSTELGKKGLSFTHKALSILKLQDWKGNVRELENTIAKAIVMKKDDLQLNSKELGFTKSKISFSESQESDKNSFEGSNFTEKINILELKILVQELEKNDWNKSKTANSLGLTRDKLYRLLNKHNRKQA